MRFRNPCSSRQEWQCYCSREAQTAGKPSEQPDRPCVISICPKVSLAPEPNSSMLLYEVTNHSMAKEVEITSSSSPEKKGLSGPGSAWPASFVSFLELPRWQHLLQEKLQDQSSVISSRCLLQPPSWMEVDCFLKKVHRVDRRVVNHAVWSGGTQCTHWC